MIYKILVLVGLFVSVVGLGDVISQAPQAIPFQATARNANGVLLPNKTVSLRFTIRDANSFGTTVYQETQSAMTNAQGLFLANIGQGNVVSGVFANINWSVNTKFIQIELDTTNTGTVYRDIGTQQMLSVPYALNAKKADSATIALNGSPVSSVTAIASKIIPTGWLLCNGQAVSRSTYSSLFTSIGTTYGKGDGSTTFNVPDYRGMFLRGVDAGAGNDPDTASRVAQGTGTALVGGNLGTVQMDAFQGHLHRLLAILDTQNGHEYGFSYGSPNNKGSAFKFTDSGAYGTDGGYGTPRTTSETRPKNVYVNYIIKY